MAGAAARLLTGTGRQLRLITGGKSRRKIISNLRMVKCALGPGGASPMEIANRTGLKSSVVGMSLHRLFRKKRVGRMAGQASRYFRIGG